MEPNILVFWQQPGIIKDRMLPTLNKSCLSLLTQATFFSPLILFPVICCHAAGSRTAHRHTHWFGFWIRAHHWYFPPPVKKPPFFISMGRFSLFVYLFVIWTRHRRRVSNIFPPPRYKLIAVHKWG